MGIDLGSLHKAIARLEEALAEHVAEPSRSLLRDGLIQRFEFTYDLAVKMLRRVLAARSDSAADIDRMSFPSLMRTAFEQGLVDETWPSWLDFREHRNIAAQAYHEDKAKAVAEAIPAFLGEVRELTRRLEPFALAESAC